MFANILNGIKGAVFEGEDTPAATPAQAPQGAAQPVKVQGSSLNFTPHASVNPDMVAAIRKQTFSRNTVDELDSGQRRPR